MREGHLMGGRMKKEVEFGLIGGGYTFQNIIKFHKKLGNPSIEVTKRQHRLGT